VIVETVRSEKNPNIGYNVITDKFEDLIAAGVIDPAKVTRSALQNAASIAGLMLTTEALISEFQEDNKTDLASGGHVNYFRDKQKQAGVAANLRDSSVYLSA